eukprot:scaffold28545_cov37-Tisochrysis_lutea.AAC.2
MNKEAGARTVRATPAMSSKSDMVTSGNAQPIRCLYKVQRKRSAQRRRGEVKETAKRTQTEERVGRRTRKEIVERSGPAAPALQVRQGRQQTVRAPPGRLTLSLREPELLCEPSSLRVEEEKILGPLYSRLYFSTLHGRVPCRTVSQQATRSPTPSR